MFVLCFLEMHEYTLILCYLGGFCVLVLCLLQMHGYTLILFYYLL